MHEEDRQLYLTLVDGRVQDARDLADTVIGWAGVSPIHVRDVGSVRKRRPRTALQYRDRRRRGCGSAQCLQPAGRQHRRDRRRAASRTPGLAPRAAARRSQLAFFYDQSQFVREGVRSVWEAIFIGLALSIVVLYGFLRTISTTIVAALAIPVTVLTTLVGMHVFHMSFQPNDARRDRGGDRPGDR